jgi:hypothetical protein
MKVIPLDKDGKAEVQGSSRTIAVPLNNTNSGELKQEARQWIDAKPL